MVTLNSFDDNILHGTFLSSVDGDSLYTNLYVDSKQYPKYSDFIRPNDKITTFVKRGEVYVDYCIHNSTLKFNNYYLDELTGFTLFNLDNGNKASITISFQYYYWKTQWEEIEWVAKFSPSVFLNTFYKEICSELGVDSVSIQDSDNPLDKSIDIYFDYEVNEDTTFDGLLPQITNKLDDVANYVIKRLENIVWDELYESNEVLFQKEFLLPLFRRMDFYDMYLNHGSGEHGKDFIIVEVDKFQNIIYSSVQVKKGDLRGDSRKEIQDLVDQAISSFKVPYEYPKTDSRVFISKYIVVVSGIITKSAKRELIHRIDQSYRPLITFLDKSDLLKLYDRYFK